MINTKIIYKILGSLLFIEVALMMTCLGVALVYDEDDVFSFLVSIVVTLVAGILCRLKGYKADNNLSRRDAYLVVTVAWVVFSLFGTMPYMVGGYIDNFTDAFFETMSGFTTTGATIINDVECLPHGILFWRSLTQWIGGLGIVFFTVAVFPIFGLGDMHLFAAESVGPMRAKLHPRISITARWILTVYIGLTVIATVAFYAAGMGWFDALCHSMSAVSTGGFSTKQASIAAFASPLIEYVTVLFMFVGGVSLSLQYLFIFKGRVKELFRDTEFRTYLMFVLFFTAIISVGLFLTTTMTAEWSFRTALFQVVSIQTTTGFATVDYTLWSPLLWLMLCGLMFVGACSGSTSGAMKCVRVATLFKVMWNEFKRIVHPNAVLPVRMARKIVPTSVQSAILAYTVIYFFMVIVGLVVNMAFGIDFLNSFGLSVASVGNVGPALGNYGPMDSLALLPAGVKWFCSFQMLVGRLEFFAVLLLLTPIFWKRQ